MEGVGTRFGDLLAIVCAHWSRGLIDRLKTRAWQKLGLWVQPEAKILDFGSTLMYLEDFQGLEWGHLKLWLKTDKLGLIGARQLGLLVVWRSIELAKRPEVWERVQSDSR